MEEKTHPEVIIIDDDDEDYVKPLKFHKDKVKTKASSKDVIVILDDDEVSDASSGITHKTLTVYSPEKKFKISEKKIKMLRGLVKLTNVDLTGNGKITPWKVGVNSELEKPLLASERNVQVGWQNAIHFSVSICSSCKFSNRLDSLKNLYCNLAAAIDTEWNIRPVYLKSKGQF